MVYDLESKMIDLHDMQIHRKLPERAARHQAKTAVVFYNGEMVIRSSTVDYRDKKVLEIGGVQFRQVPGFDPKFLVFVAVRDEG